MRKWTHPDNEAPRAPASAGEHEAQRKEPAAPASIVTAAGPRLPRSIETLSHGVSYSGPWIRANGSRTNARGDQTFPTVDRAANEADRTAHTVEICSVLADICDTLPLDSLRQLYIAAGDDPRRFAELTRHAIRRVSPAATAWDEL